MPGSYRPQFQEIDWNSQIYSTKVYCKECKHYFRNLDGEAYECCIWVRGDYIEESPLQRGHFEEKKIYSDPLIKIIVLVTQKIRGENMKTVYCHLMGPYKRDGQYPEIKESIAIDSLIAYIGEFVQIGEKEYKIQTVQNILTRDDGQVRVYIMWEAMDYDLYMNDSMKSQMQPKSNLVTL